MAELIAVLTTIALLDSMSMITISTVPMVTLLSMRRPYLLALVFILGTFASYFLCGILVFAGLGSLFGALNDVFRRWWEYPDTAYLIVELLIGAALLVMALVTVFSEKKQAQKREPRSASPTAAFLFAAFLVVVGIPGAVPLFAAVDQMLRADLSTGKAALMLLYYNLIFVSPLFAIVAVRAAMGERADSVFDAANKFLERWGERVVVLVMLLLGLALVADSIGWLAGRYSLIPIA